MSSENETATIVKGKNQWVFGGIITFIVLFVALVLVYGSPSAESVFKSMNEKMLQTKTVKINQNYEMKASDGSTADMELDIAMDLESQEKLKAKGKFSMDMVNSGTPISLAGDVVKIGDDNYVRFSKISSSSPEQSANFEAIEAKLKNEWIKVREGDDIASMANNILEYTSTILPTPYANLSADQRKEVLAILQDKSTYTIEESSNVTVDGVSAYKYELKYDEGQYDKFTKKIADYVDYFKHDTENDSSIKSLTVWVNISTKELIKIEFEGETSDGDEMSGTMEFSDYDKAQSIEKPSDYSIESELTE